MTDKKLGALWREREEAEHVFWFLLRDKQAVRNAAFSYSEAVRCKEHLTIDRQEQQGKDFQSVAERMDILRRELERNQPTILQYLDALPRPGSIRLTLTHHNGKEFSPQNANHHSATILDDAERNVCVAIDSPDKPKESSRAKRYYLCPIVKCEQSATDHLLFKGKTRDFRQIGVAQDLASAIAERKDS